MHSGTNAVSFMAILKMGEGVIPCIIKGVCSLSILQVTEVLCINIYKVETMTVQFDVLF